ncbi:MAG: hypothetical protein RBS34_06395 [Desulfofustis sp.]|nr:hypothetical protein [Desulfofustis sp.]
MDKPVKPMIIFHDTLTTIALPLPLFVVVEDVGWWQGSDDSANNGPYRNSFPRYHCLADYEALVHLSELLSMRLAIAMVIGEWDRTNLLAGVRGATWMGDRWENSTNQGPWLDTAAAYLQSHEDHLELAVHGLCHEYWQNGRLCRSEFHDQSGMMRPPAIIASHLVAFRSLLQQNGFLRFPRLFVPPALFHSCGNGNDSIQCLLHSFGIEYVTTRFARCRHFSPPIHEKITWECGVTILERGVAPVPWKACAAAPEMIRDQPIVPLHWGNLLHGDPSQNLTVINRWAMLLLSEANGFMRIAAADSADCWCQAAVYYLARLQATPSGVSIDLSDVPATLLAGQTIALKIKSTYPHTISYSGADLASTTTDEHHVSTVRLRPLGDKIIVIHLKSSPP